MYTMNVPKNNIIYHCDDLYVDWAITSIRSVLANNKNIKFHIIADINYNNVKKFYQLQTETGADIDIHAVSTYLYDRYKIDKKYKRLLKRDSIKPLYEINKEGNLDEHPHVSNSLYYFVYWEYLFKELNTALYLDCDTIIDGSLDELFALDLEGKDFAMCKSYTKDFVIHNNKKYTSYNGGVMFGNIKTACKIIPKIYEHTVNNLHWAKFGLQESSMVFLNERVKEIDKKWNICVKREKGEKRTKGIIYHYMSWSIKPYILDDLCKKYEHNSCR